MSLLKSCMAGILSLIVAVLLFVMAMVAILLIYARLFIPGQSIGWDPTSLFHHWPFWVFAIGEFMAGFAWKFRRVDGPRRA